MTPLKPSPLRFHFPEGYDPKRLFDDLAHHHSIRKGSPSERNIALYDTFDWRLYHRSLVLCRSGGIWYMRKLFEDTATCRAKVSPPPRFARDFPNGRLKDLLGPIIRNRALIRLMEVSSRKTPYDILKRDGTVRARLVPEELRFSGEKGKKGSAACLWLTPAGKHLRGVRALKNRLEEIGCVACRETEVYFTSLESLGIKPGGYTTKSDSEIDPAMRSDEAMKRVLRFLLQVMRANEDKIGEDLDAEFLHDFRVALRRARTGLGEMGHIFPPEVMRDLDVYLLDESKRKAMLPAALRDDIEPVFKYLRKERSKAFRRLVRHLGSRKYRESMGTWGAFLDNRIEVSLEVPDAGLPIGEMSREKISEKYRRILEKGNSILGNPKDRKLHLLRLACKELRYLLEFFAGLFPPGKADAAIRKLKKLQDLLGRFNDLRIKEEYLLAVAGAVPRRGKRRTGTLLAIGSLFGALDREKQTLKDAFARTFAVYASPANRKLFRELLAGPIPATPSRSSGGLP
ncbi:MAG: CHAD protein [Actinobacteria bacterium]|nr:CHAD protein [Actinomycetota bacterium]